MVSKMGKEWTVQPDAQNPRNAMGDRIPVSCLLAHFYICVEVHVPPLTQVNKIYSFWLIKEIYIDKRWRKGVVGACFWAVGNRRQPCLKCMESGLLPCGLAFPLLSLYGPSVWRLTALSLSCWFSFTSQACLLSFAVEGWAGSLTIVLGWLMF